MIGRLLNVEKAPRVVKVGGAALADASWLERFAAAAAQSTSPLVIVHGGGPDISALAQRLGIGVTWYEGRRVTSPAALDVAGMVLNGRVNKAVVQAMINAGADAVGLSGVDGALLRAEVVDGGALGRVGRVTRVRTELLHSLLAAGHTVVISPVSIGQDGGQLNVNADDAAAAVAAALGAAELVFLTDVPGVMDAAEVCTQLDPERALGLLAAGVASGGMAVKVGAAVRALRAGVCAVRIGSERVFHDESAGTLLTAAAAEVA